MHIVRYADATGFVEAVEDFLLAQEISNSLLLGNALREIYGVPPHAGTVYYAAAFEGDTIVGAISHQPPFAVILNAGMAPDVGAAFARQLLDDGQPVPSVIGPKPQADAFAAFWHDLTGQRAAIRMAQGTYALREVRERGSAPGSLRTATQDDLALVAQWSQDFHDEATPDEGDFDAEDFARRRLRDSSVYLWEDGGQVVSMVGKSRPTRTGITVNLVYTPPEQRGKGYATTCVATFSQQLLDSGYAFCTLFTDLANPTSNAIYQHIGYDYVCDFMLYDFVEASTE